MENVIVVGSGCAGLTAAIYAARANLSPLVLEGRQPGGQLSTTTMVENYPGFPEGIDGPQLILNMHAQAEKFGARFAYSEVTDFEGLDGHVRIKADEEWLETRALIVASGAAARWLGLENEEKLVGHGLTSCATCDGAFYRNVPVCVIGGGDSALDEALVLARHAAKVTVLHRGRTLDAQQRLLDEAAANGKIEVALATIVDEILGDDGVLGVRLRDANTGATRVHNVAGVFIYVGLEPNTAFLRDMVALDASGHIATDIMMCTSVPGIFAAGDIRQHSVAQLAAAAGDGATAAIAAFRHLKGRG